MNIRKLINKYATKYKGTFDAITPAQFEGIFQKAIAFMEKMFAKLRAIRKG